MSAARLFEFAEKINLNIYYFFTASKFFGEKRHSCDTVELVRLFRKIKSKERREILLKTMQGALEKDSRSY